MLHDAQPSRARVPIVLALAASLVPLQALAQTQRLPTGDDQVVIGPIDPPAGSLERSPCDLVPALSLLGPAANDYNRDGRSDIAFHRPGSGDTQVPVLLSDGEGGWTVCERASPKWANQSGVTAISGDFNGDGLQDAAFHRPGGDWTSVPVLLNDGEGGWKASEAPVPAWANAAGGQAVAGDFNGDGRTDIAFLRSGSLAKTVPVLLADGSGGWTSHEGAAPEWANEPGVVAIPGDFDGDGLGDIAFQRPGGDWTTLPVLLADGKGGWRSASGTAPEWAQDADALAIEGDYNGDGLTDIALHRPHGGWSFVAVLLADGEGGWKTIKEETPSWVQELNTFPIPGDYNGDGLTDLAFQQPGGDWGTLPVLLANGKGGWKASKKEAPAWANELGALAITGDFDGDGFADLAFHNPGSAWKKMPVLLADGIGGWRPLETDVPAWVHDGLTLSIDIRRLPKVLTSQASPAVPSASSGSELYAVDDTLTTPVITSVDTTDNAIILNWSDSNTQHTGYLVMIWQLGTHLGPTEYRIERQQRSAWFLGLRTGVLVPGARYHISLFAIGDRGVSREDTGRSTVEVRLSEPSIRIYNPDTDQVSNFNALSGFSPWDHDNNGVVNDAQGSAGAYPLFPDANGLSAVGRNFDSHRAVRSNVILGYFTATRPFQFVAFHLRINPLSNAATPVSLIFGETTAGIPDRPWIGIDPVLSNYRVINGDSVLGTPNIVEGLVTGITLASDGSNRVVEYGFRLALLPQ